MSFNCLDPKTNIWGPHFLEASAGTGKTFAIEHVVARLILENTSEKPMHLEDILVVTFTKAATRELKSRIRENLESLLEQLQSSTYICPYLKNLSDVSESIQNIQDALYNFEQSHIFTIHGFCHRMLLEFSLQAGIQMENIDADQLQGKRLIKEAIRNFFRYEISECEFSPGQISLLLRRYKDMEKLVETLCKNLSQESDEGEAFHRLFEACQLEALKAPELSKEKIKKDFSLLFPHYKKNKKWTEDQLYTQIAHLLQFIASPTLEFFDRLVESELTLFSFLSNDNRKLRSSLSEKERKNALEFFIWADKHIYPMLREASCTNQIFNRLLHKTQEVVKKALEKHRLFTPDILLEKMYEALEHPSFLQAVQKKFSAIIIDEFQDTDPIQWQIFARIVSKKVQALYLVGDPKQSIYAFRKADLYTYFKAAKQVGENHHYYLDTNYRSTPSLIHALNALFSLPHTHPWFYLPKLNQKLLYRKVSVGNAESTLPGPPIRFFIAEAESGRFRWPTAELEEKKLFSFIASELKTLEDEGKSLKDCAVLVKDRYQAQSLRQFLLKYKINSRLISRGSLGQSPLFFALQDLFRSVYHPRNTKLLKIALRGPLLGWSFSQLQRCGDILPEFVYSQLYLLKQSLEQEGLSAFFRELLNSSWEEEGRTVKERLLSQEDLSAYQHFLQLMEHLLELEQKKNLTRDQLFAYLSTIKISDPEEEEQMRLRMDVEEETLQILTIHMSKGLEFPIVFALGVCARSPLDQQADDLQIQEQNAEKLRQLYVAFTRAKERLYIPLVFDEKKPSGLLARASALELFLGYGENPFSSEEVLQSQSKKSILDHLQDLQSQGHIAFIDCSKKCMVRSSSIESAIDLISPPALQVDFPSSYIQSFTQLRKEEAPSKKGSLPITLPKGISIHSMPAGAQVGVLVHAIFEEVLTFGKLVRSSVLEVINCLVVDEALSLWKEPLLEAILQTFSIPLSVKGDPFCLKDLDPESLQTEVEFYMTMEKNPLHRMKGFIDLFFRHKDKYYLIDWKSNWLGPSDTDYSMQSLEEAMKEHDYFLQGSLYAEALKRYLSDKEDRPFTESFGGMFYIFLRGVHEPNHHGVFSFIPN